MKIDIIHYESPRSDDAFIEFHVRQRNRYAAFGAETAAPAELPDPALATLIAARTERGEMAGGVRFLRRSMGASLPLERIAAQFGIHVPVPGGAVAEVGGLWVDHRLQGTGLGRLLAEAVIAVAPFLRIDAILILAHQFYRFLRPAGYMPMAGVPAMAYPDDRYVSQVSVCEPAQVPGATDERRDMIFRMRQEWATQGFLRCGSDMSDVPAQRSKEANHEQYL